MGLFPGRIFGSPPERGDVAVFKYPGDQGQGVNRTDYIKRIVGMPVIASRLPTACSTSTERPCRACASAIM